MVSGEVTRGEKSFDRAGLILGTGGVASASGGGGDGLVPGDGVRSEWLDAGDVERVTWAVDSSLPGSDTAHGSEPYPPVEHTAAGLGVIFSIDLGSPRSSPMVSRCW